MVGIAALYYWSLYGAWSIVIDKTGGFSGKHYQYLESKMFPIELDRRYLLTLGLYAGFIILVELTLLAALRAGPSGRFRGCYCGTKPILLVGFRGRGGQLSGDPRPIERGVGPEYLGLLVYAVAK